ncbi:MAG: SDR family oxidoreductase [Vulcanimicrobiaceae bacterium]
MPRPSLAVLTCLALAAAAVARRALTRRFDLRGRIVVIVGGSRGLGLALAREAAARGATLALLARSDSELAAARDELAAGGTRIVVRACDIRLDESVAAAFAAVVRELGPIDVLLNVAGIIEVGPVESLLLDDYVDAIATNYLGAVRTVEAVRPAMQARRAGRIVNVASIGGVIAVPHLLPYCASKFALVGYSRGLHAELARFGIVVTTIVPGLMRTGSPPHATFAGRPEAEYALFAPVDALPFTSVSAAHAARAILDATERGERERVVSPQARAGVAAARWVPATLAALLVLTARVLPSGAGRMEHRPGSASTGLLDRAGLGGLGERERARQHEDLDPEPGRRPNH